MDQPTVFQSSACYPGTSVRAKGDCRDAFNIVTLPDLVYGGGGGVPESLYEKKNKLYMKKAAARMPAAWKMFGDRGYIREEGRFQFPRCTYPHVK